MSDKVIEISNVKPINKGDIFASFDAYIIPLDLEINDILVFQKGANRWINMPSKKNERDGTYKESCKFRSAQKSKNFKDQVKRMFDDFMEKNPNLDAIDAIKITDSVPF